MANDEDSLFGPTVAEVSRLRDELREHVAMRWQLARLELSVAFADLRRLAICLAVLPGVVPSSSTWMLAATKVTPTARST